MKTFFFVYLLNTIHIHESDHLTQNKIFTTHTVCDVLLLLLLQKTLWSIQGKLDRKNPTSFPRYHTTHKHDLFLRSVIYQMFKISSVSSYIPPDTFISLLLHLLEEMWFLVLRCNFIFTVNTHSLFYSNHNWLCSPFLEMNCDAIVSNL